jgi:hypothetical protein
MRRPTQAAMPQHEAITSAAATIAQGWWALAVVWHVFFGAVVLAAVKWNMSQRTLGWLLAAPLASVSAMAWGAGNPFNGALFGVLSIALAILAARFPHERRRFASRPVFSAGLVLLAFGWVYPHFLEPSHWAEYGIAAPLGLLPCPTLAAVIGVSLMFGPLCSSERECRTRCGDRIAVLAARSAAEETGNQPRLCGISRAEPLAGTYRLRSWAGMISSAGVLYGAMGVFWLGVSLDVGLLGGAAVLWVLHVNSTRRSVRATNNERIRALPGDDLITTPVGSLTHAITLRSRPRDVWPWLVQMGAGTRGGWYSYDALDNGGRPSAIRIVPELQRIAVGMVFPALPNAADGFTVLRFKPEQFLVLAWTSPERVPIVTWAFVVEPVAEDATRLIARARGGAAYRFHGLPWWAAKPIVTLIHFVMQRKQLFGIARRVERAPSIDAPRVPAKARAA